MLKMALDDFLFKMEFEQDGYMARIRRWIRGGYTLREIKNIWADYHYRTLSKSGVTSYELSWKACEPLWDYVFDDIKFIHWQRCVNRLHDLGLGYSSQKKFKNMVGQISDFAIKNEMGHHNYAPMLELDSHTPVFIKKPFTELEIARLWNYYNRYTGIDLILILIYTGMRVGEFLRVNMQEDVHLPDKYLIVRESKTAAGRNRVIPLHNDILPFVKARRKFDMLASTRKGHEYGSYTAFRKMFTGIMNRFSMNHSIHECRHTCATLLNSAGANDVCIKKILGHAGTNITEQVYIHKQVSDLLEAINMIEGKQIGNKYKPNEEDDIYDDDI